MCVNAPTLRRPHFNSDCYDSLSARVFIFGPGAEWAQAIELWARVRSGGYYYWWILLLEMQMLDDATWYNYRPCMCSVQQEISVTVSNQTVMLAVEAPLRAQAHFLL